MIPIHVSIVAIPPSDWRSLPKDRPLAELFKDASGAERRIRKNVDERRDATRFTQLITQIEAVSLELARRSGKTWGLSGRALESGVYALEWSDGLIEHRASDYIRLLERLQAINGFEDLPAVEGPRPLDPMAWVAPGRIQALRVLLQTSKNDLHPGWLAWLPLAKAKAAWSRIVVAWREVVGSFRGTAALAGDDDEFGLGAIGMSVLAPGGPVTGRRRVLERVNTRMIERLMPTLDYPARVELARTVQENVAFHREAERADSAVVVVVSQGVETR